MTLLTQHGHQIPISIDAGSDHMNNPSKTANREYIAHKNVEDAVRYLEAYFSLSNLDASNDNHRSSQMEAILVASVVMYCRPFKKSKSGEIADPLIDYGRLLEGRDDFMDLHERIIACRDNAVAHADWSRHTCSHEYHQDLGVSIRGYAPPFYMQGISPEKFIDLAKYVSRKLLDSCLKSDYEWNSYQKP